MRTAAAGDGGGDHRLLGARQVVVLVPGAAAIGPGIGGEVLGGDPLGVLDDLTIALPPDSSDAGEVTVAGVEALDHLEEGILAVSGDDRIGSVELDGVLGEHRAVRSAEDDRGVGVDLADQVHGHLHVRQRVRVGADADQIERIPLEHLLEVWVVEVIDDRIDDLGLVV